MQLKHNKKRNVGLTYEFLVRNLAKCMLENNDIGLKKTKAILSKHFNPNTNLSKELKLFRTLLETNAPNETVAHRIMEKVRTACEMQSHEALELEKTALIHEINKNINEENKFFDIQLADYKTYATIQVLLNEWRNKNLLESVSPSSMNLEMILVEHLTKVKTKPTKKELQEKSNKTTDSVDKIALGIFYDKLNKKYSNTLNEEQKKLIGDFVLLSEEELKVSLEDKRKEYCLLIEQNIQNYSDNKQLLSLLEETKKVLDNLETKITSGNIQEQTMMEFFLSLSNLKKDLPV